jgi:hypothetical protein
MSLSTDFADGREGHQSFEYLSPGLQLHLHDLLLPPSPFADSPPEWVHVVCSVARVQAMIDEKKSLQLGQDTTWSGNLVWEPMPVSLLFTLESRAYYQSSCIPAELPSITELAPHLAIISPNILEIQSLLAIEPSAHTTQEEVSQAAQVFHDLISAQNTTVPAIIVRAGRLGSYTLSVKWSGWVPPYFTTDEQDRVIDPTGGGNGFLGGLCAGLLLSDGDMREGTSRVTEWG